MIIKNFIIGLALGLLSLSGFVIAAKQGLGWAPKLGVVARIRKALLTGFGFLVFVISGLVAIDYLVNPNIGKTWSLAALEGLFCFAFPIALLPIVGSFIWFSRRNATHQYFSSKLREIIENSKKSQ